MVNYSLRQNLWMRSILFFWLVSAFNRIIRFLLKLTFESWGNIQILIVLRLLRSNDIDASYSETWWFTFDIQTLSVWENEQTLLKLKRNNKFYWKLYQIVFVKLQNIAQERKSIQEKNFNFYTSHMIRIKYVIEFERTSSIIRFNNQIQ